MDLLIDTLYACSPGDNAKFIGVTNKRANLQGKTVASHIPKSPNTVVYDMNEIISDIIEGIRRQVSTRSHDDIRF